MKRIGLTVLFGLALLGQASTALAERFVVYYTNYGCAWRVPAYDSDRYAEQRNQIWLQYKRDLADAKARYDRAIENGDDPSVAQQNLEDDDRRAEDDRTSALDQLYPNSRWDNFSTLYPELFITGIITPGCYISFDVIDGQFDDLVFYQPCPSYTGWLFGIQYGRRVRYHDWCRKRDDFCGRLESSIRLPGGNRGTLAALHGVQGDNRQRTRDHSSDHSRSSSGDSGHARDNRESTRGDSHRDDSSRDSHRDSHHDSRDHSDDSRGRSGDTSGRDHRDRHSNGDSGQSRRTDRSHDDHRSSGGDSRHSGDKSNDKRGGGH